MSRLVCILNRSVRKWSESCWVAILSNTSCSNVVTSKSSLVSTKTKQCQSFTNKLVMSLPELRSKFDEENVAAVLEAISSHQVHGSSCARTICLFNLSVVEVNFLSKLKMGYTVYSIVYYQTLQNVTLCKSEMVKAKPSYSFTNFLSIHWKGPSFGDTISASPQDQLNRNLQLLTCNHDCIAPPAKH